MNHRMTRRCTGLKPCEPRGDVHAELTTLVPASACTVTSWETVIECELAIASFRLLYPQVAVYVVVTDEESQRHLAECEFNDLTIIRDQLRQMKVEDMNTYHRPEVMVHKMTAMRAALSKHADTLFFDADMVFCSWLTVTGLDARAILSHSSSVRGELVRTGVFNAGLVWTSAKNFPDWWESRWLKHPKKGDLYEQTALNDCLEIMPCEFFSRAHNIGFWQGDIGKRVVKSLHCHLTSCIDQKVDEFCLTEIKAFRDQAWETLRRCYPEVYELALRICSQAGRDEDGDGLPLMAIDSSEAVGTTAVPGRCAAADSLAGW